MRKIQKITKIEGFILVLMFFCYISSFYFLIQQRREYVLLFFVLHGILTVAYFYISQDRFVHALLDIEEKATVESYGIIDEETQIIAKLKKENKALDEQIRELTKENEGRKLENEELIKKLEEKELQYLETNELEKVNLLLPENEALNENDLLTLIREVYRNFEMPCRKSGIRLELATSFEHVIMRCDKRYIQVLLSNIIDNSMKYMNRSGSLIITISDIGEEGIFMVCKDNGDGLPIQEVPHIFELNYQGSNRKSGNGLGLAQVKAIVEHYKGTVYAKSDVNEGMAIYIQFPVESKG